MRSGNWSRALDLGLLWLRVLAGLGMAHHGFGKIFGGRMDQFAQGVAQLGFPMPETFAWAAALSEFLGGVCLILGLGTRLAAAAIFATMSVAAFLRHAADLLSVKELALVYWTITGTLMLTGAGVFSFDQRRVRR